MEKLKFDLERMETGLTLMQYELIRPIAEELLEQGYPPVRVAALMFRYGCVFQKKLTKEARKERTRQRMENQIKDEGQETESQTSGENEGSI